MFKQHKAPFIAIRPVWEDPFIEEFDQRISHAIRHFLGSNPLLKQKASTLKLNQLMGVVKGHFFLFKEQLIVAYMHEPERLNALLDNLGYPQYYQRLKTYDQELYTEFLATFAFNIDKDRQEIESKGISHAFIEDIVQHAKQIEEGNVFQESMKTEAVRLTKDAIKEFNEIYRIVILICRMGRVIFRDDAVLKKCFSFSYNLKQLNQAHTSDHHLQSNELDQMPENITLAQE